MKEQSESPPKKQARMESFYNMSVTEVDLRLPS